MANGFLSGRGTEDFPFLIEDARDLAAIDKKNQQGFFYYAQTEDIDMTGVDHVGIGGVKGPPFRGVYDGECNKIINFTGDHGLFRYIDKSDIRNINIVDADIKESGILGLSVIQGGARFFNCKVSGKSGAGGLFIDGVQNYDDSDLVVFESCQALGTSKKGMFTAFNGATADKCFFKGSINSEGEAGGFASIAEGSSFLDCYAEGDVTGALNIAGFVSLSTNNKYDNCYFSGNALTSSDHCGGFINQSRYDNVVNCYATGTATSSNLEGGSYVSGFFAQATDSTFRNCVSYADVSGGGAWVCGFGSYVHNETTCVNCVALGSVTGKSFVFGFSSNEGYFTKPFDNCFALNDSVMTKDTNYPFSGTFGYEFSETTDYSSCYYNSDVIYNNRERFGLYGTPTSDKNPINFDKFGDDPDYQELFKLIVCPIKSRTTCQKINISKLLGGYTI